MPPHFPTSPLSAAATWTTSNIMPNFQSVSRNRHLGKNNFRKEILLSGQRKCNLCFTVADIFVKKRFQVPKKKQFKIFKERQLNKHFIRAQMSILQSIPNRTRKIVRKVSQCGRKYKKTELRLAIQKLALRTSIKCSSKSEPLAKCEADRDHAVQDRPLSANLNYFQSYNPYTLGSINSIVLKNGRIYDLLLLKKQDARLSRAVKCRCPKSRCSVKYCDCYANGQACGPLCECSGCLNLTARASAITRLEDRFCRCSKSGCRKKYCECFQRGDSCSSRCACQNCRNSSGQLCTHQH